MIGYQKLNSRLAYTPADEKTLNFIRRTDYGYIKILNNDMKDSKRQTIFKDIVKRNSFQKTNNKIR